MPLFICERCRAIDNSALGGTFWSAFSSMDLFPPPYAGEVLCVECAPTTFKDGSPNKDAGRWHGYFQKRIASEEDAAKYRRQRLPDDASAILARAVPQ